MKKISHKEDILNTAQKSFLISMFVLLLCFSYFFIDFFSP
jgi:hypothetical protein